MGIKPINVLITGFDRTSSVFGSLSKKAHGFGKSLEGITGVSRKLGAGLLGLGVGGAFATGLSSLPGQLIAIEESATRLAFTEKFTAEQSLKVGKAVRKMSRDTLQGQLDLNRAVDTIGDAGFSLDETLSIMPMAAKQATVFGKSLDLTAGIAKTLGSNFDIAAGQMSGAIDIVSELGTANFDLDELAAVLPRIGQASKSLNLNGTKGLAQFAAGLEVIRGETRDSGAAAKGFAKLLEGVFDSGTMERFRKGGVDGPGVNVMAELEAAGKRGENQLEAYLRIVKRVTDSQDKAVREARIKDLFGDQDAAAVRAILDNLEAYRAAIQKYQSSGGRTETGFQKQLEDTSAQWKQLKATVLSTDFKPVARGITLVNDALQWMNKDAKNTELVINGIIGAVAVGGGLLALGSLASILKDISIVLGIISKGGPAAIKVIKSLGALSGIPMSTTIPGGPSIPGPGRGKVGKLGRLAKGALGVGGVAMVALPIAEVAYDMAKKAIEESSTEGVQRGSLARKTLDAAESDSELRRKVAAMGAQYGDRTLIPSSNPDAIRAAAGQQAPGRVEGEMVIRLENFPTGTKVSTKSHGVDLRPELGRAFP